MKTLFILSLFKQGDKIKVSTLFHLLRGKRTVSVLMNGFLFDNLAYFGLFPNIEDKLFYKRLHHLISEELLTFSKETGEAQITAKGMAYLLKNTDTITYYTAYLNGYEYAKTEDEMWRLLQFFVQVTSHLSYQDKRYIPLEASPRYQWKVKALISKLNKKTVGSDMKGEWSRALSQLSEEEGNFIAQQFSGYQLNGKAEQQLLSDTSAFKRMLYRKNVYHHLFRSIEGLPDDAILRQALKEDLEKNQNQSMLRTRELWQSDRSLSEITQMRQMRPSTVNDHILELAMSTDSVVFEALISSEDKKKLETLKTPCQTWRFAELRQQFELDYFSFRLYQIIQIKKERGD